MKTIIGVDVGGTNLRAARFDTDLNMLERTEQPSRADDGTDAVLERLIETIRQVLPSDPDDLLGIGVALPGPLDTKTGMVIKTPNLPFENVPIGNVLRDALGRGVHIGNDADLAGLGEYEMGAGRTSEYMIFITISTGIGGGIIIDGQPYIGQGQGGEIGHMVIMPDGPLCGCGHRGHLEALASGTAIRREASEHLQGGASSLMLDMVQGDIERVTAKTVHDAADQGDGLAKQIINQAGYYLGIGIASLMMMLNPDTIVLGGSVTKIGDMLFDPMHEAIREYVMHPRYAEETIITAAKLGDDMGLVGAAAFVRAKKGK